MMILNLWGDGIHQERWTHTIPINLEAGYIRQCNKLEHWRPRPRVTMGSTVDSQGFRKLFIGQKPHLHRQPWWGFKRHGEDALALAIGKPMEGWLLLAGFHVQHLGFVTGDPTSIMALCSLVVIHQEGTMIPPTSRGQVWALARVLRE